MGQYALCCCEEVWSRAAGPTLRSLHYVEMGSLLQGEHSSAHAVLLQCMKDYSVASPRRSDPVPLVLLSL